MNEITIGDKIYISSKRAAEITGYAKDYVGQLSREGHIDAKMVGRSWYVYEPSIRAHRFGEAAVVVPEVPVKAPEEENVAEAEVPEASSTWERPTYKAETFDMIPELPVSVYEAPVAPPEETLTDMQTAWKEWFDRKQELQVPEIETAEVIDARNDAYAQEHQVKADEREEAIEDDEEVEIPLHRIMEEPEELADTYVEEDSEPITIHHIAAPVPVYTPAPVSMDLPVRREVPTREVELPAAPQARIIKERVIRRKRKARGSYVPATALLIALSIITIAVATIGTGFADKYLQTFVGKNPVVNFLVGTSEFSR